VTAADSAPPRPAASPWLSGYRAARTRFPPRPAAAQWPATAQPREQAAELMAGLLPGNASAPEALLDWLAGQDGSCWQQRWLASGADAAAAAWWQLPRDWLRRSHCAPVGSGPRAACLPPAAVAVLRAILTGSNRLCQ
jgi:hypothetical protein